MLLALLERFQPEGQQLTTAQAAADQHGEHGMIAKHGSSRCSCVSFLLTRSMAITAACVETTVSARKATTPA